MSRTQRKLQAMSAQEMLIQEKKRKIEEKLRVDGAKKIHVDNNSQQQVNNDSMQHQLARGNIFKNDGSFLEQFQKSQGQLSSTIINNDTQQSSLSKGTDCSSMNSLPQFAPPWFPSISQPPSSFPVPFNPSQLPPFPLPLPPPPSSSFTAPSSFFPPAITNNSTSFVPPPFLPSSFPLPPPLPPPQELFSKMLQTPPPPLPVPLLVNTSTTTTSSNSQIKSEDLYDPLKAEDDPEEETEQTNRSMEKPVSRVFNVKKEITIKIEPNQFLSTNPDQHEHQKHDNGGIRRHQSAITTSTDLSSSSKLWWNDDEDDDTTDQKSDIAKKSGCTEQSAEENDRKRKSRWNSSNVKQEPIDNKFVQQIHEATEKAKSFVAQLNEQMKLYPQGYDGKKMNDGQFVEQRELQSIYQTMMVKRRELEQLARQQQRKREYDSDEETDSETGTWEHRLRTAEMDITREWAVKLTEMADGKHHIGDFIPPEELEKFMKTYSTLKHGETPDVSDYRDFKIQAENIGYRLLEKFGWKEGQGVGKTSQGIVNPINKGTTPINHSGFGQERPSELDRNDDEFQMYRKRMMLAYRFRPNPLNNPRRDYY
ncbi:unnamed protein product [Adineta ricciae]|uniref:G-patch domain-containing protein n=1 Tax=Adineta ricciae TaxID=249248 RepID=A0A815A0P7_ADIRI|nr:unnamed protein product [Adineta ricciae]